jgi:hypothetical protein
VNSEELIDKGILHRAYLNAIRLPPDDSANRIKFLLLMQDRFGKSVWFRIEIQTAFEQAFSARHHACSWNEAKKSKKGAREIGGIFPGIAKRTCPRGRGFILKR